jgi:hypothetical protein
LGQLPDCCQPIRECNFLDYNAIFWTTEVVLRVVFIKDGRETDSPPMPMQAAPRIKRASTVQEEEQCPGPERMVAENRVSANLPKNEIRGFADYIVRQAG